MKWTSIVCVALAALSARPAFAQQPGRFVQPSEENLLLLSLHLDAMVLAEDLEAYQFPGGVLVPFGEICRRLELAVEVSTEKGTGTVYFAKAGNKLFIDLANRKVTLVGKTLPFDPAQVELHRKDIYIDAKLLNSWIGLGLEVDPRMSAIRVKPTEPLPMQKRLERERRAALAKGIYSPTRDPGFARVNSSYTDRSAPAVDQSVSLSFNAKRKSGFSAQSSTQIVSDVAGQGLTGAVNVGGANKGAVSNLAFGRKDPDAGLLGSLRAREVSAGQVASPAVPLVSPSQTKTGLLVSNYPLGRSNQLNGTVIEGPLPNGWDVELYRDDVLIDYRRTGTTGRYEFKYLPLANGANHYKLVFYGPHGERKEETRTFNTNEAVVPKGQNYYRLFVEPSANGATQVSFQNEIGLTRNLSGQFSLTTAQLENGMHSYFSAGVKGFGGAFYGYANLVTDPGSGSAGEIGAQILWERATVDFKQAFVNGMESELLSTQVNPIKSESLLRFTNVSMPKWTHLSPTQIEVLRQESRLGSQAWEFRNRMSYHSPWGGITNWLAVRTQDGQPTQVAGELIANRWQGGNLLQGQIGYDGAPSIRNLSIQSTRLISDLQSLSVRLYHSGAERNTGLGATLTRGIGGYAYGLSLDYSGRQGVTLGLTFSLGLLQNLSSGRWQSSAQSASSYGTAVVRAFLDTDGDGKLSRGEKPLPGVAFFINASIFGKTTGKDGTVLIDGLTPFQPADVSVAESSLANPLWVPKLVGVRLSPRPGDTPIVDFPIVGTGEISGTLFEEKEAISGHLELVDEKGNVVQKQTAAYDGFFSFSRVPVGKYSVRLAEKSGKSELVPVAVPPGGGYVDGVKVVITPKA